MSEVMTQIEHVLPLTQVGNNDVARVGGKSASLGEMIQHLSALDLKVPGGFSTTADAFDEFLTLNRLQQRIQDSLATLNTNDTQALKTTGAQIRAWIETGDFSTRFVEAVRVSYHSMGQGASIPVAVRSSATAEDLPDASFAGQQETFLNVQGIDGVLQAIKKVFASLYNDRAIAYRVHQNFAHHQVRIACCIQHMINADEGASGVLFTVDTESGFEHVMLLTASYGLGELVVQGAVNPDEYYIYKPNIATQKPAILRRYCGDKQHKMIRGPSTQEPVQVVPVAQDARQRFALSEEAVMELARCATQIEAHYGRPMDIEWIQESGTGAIHILQARPETVRSQDGLSLERYFMKEKGPLLLEGRAVGHKAGSGPVVVVADAANMNQVKEGDVLVTDMTDPDWEPVMKKASAIITNRGGRTCHAAIIARELGIPAIVGTGMATQKLQDNRVVTVSCCEGDTGFVYDGALRFEVAHVDVEAMPELPVRIMMNVGNPEQAFRVRQTPNEGVGLARLEFIISQMIGIHPRACLGFDQLTPDLQKAVAEKTKAYPSPRAYYVARLCEGISMLGAAFAPKPVIVRLSDFKSNEYAHLLGGDAFEPMEENPMLGFRGAARYTSESFAESFGLECEAFDRARHTMGLTNLQVMIPFVRTVQELKNVLALMAQHGLKRGEKGLKVIMMCELPANAVLAEDFLEHVDGFSIGSNDLTQLTLGLDRDSGLVADDFDERNPAVKALIRQAIQACRKHKKYIGICGQGPSDHPDFAAWLIQEGIESMSLNPDSVLPTWIHLGKHKEHNT